MTIDIKNFNYGGVTPLYATLESDFKSNQPYYSSSESDDNDIHDNSNNLSNVNVLNDYKNNDVSIIANNNLPQPISSPKSNHVHSYHQSLIQKSKDLKSAKQTRKRALSNRVNRKVTKQSFNHFRILSITIDMNPLSYSNNKNHSSAQSNGKHLISPLKMDFIPEDDDIDDDIDVDADDIYNLLPVNDDHDIATSSPQHQSNSTVIINNVAMALDDSPTSSNDMDPDMNMNDIDYNIIPKNVQINNKNGVKTDITYNIQPKTQQLINADKDKDNDEREYICCEIIETEETYYRGLNTLLNELIIPMFEKNMIDQKYFNKCTSNLPKILSFHELFLAQLVSAYQYSLNDNNNNTLNGIILHNNNNNNNDNIQQQYRSIAAVFNAQNREEFINLYVTYIQDYNNILDLFGNTFACNDAVSSYLRSKRRERKPLTNYLILPVQRVPRYILLLTDLLSHTPSTHIDYNDIKSALKFVCEITSEINERKRKIENMSQCLQIQESLTNLKKSIVSAHRIFEKQFVFIKKANKHQRIFFLFNDILIITNNHWKVKQIIDIRTIDIKIETVLIKKKKSTIRIGLGLKNSTTTQYERFSLLTNTGKPCIYISYSMNEICEFEKLIKKNRVVIWDNDLALLTKNDIDDNQSKSIKLLRKTLKEQGVSQSYDYKQEIISKKSTRKRCDALADMNIPDHPL